MSTGTHSPLGGAGGDGLQEQAQRVAADIQGKAQQAAGQARAQATGTLRTQLDQRSSDFAEQVNSQASDLRSVAESLREQGKHGPARAADKLAGYAERAGGYLGQKDSDALLSDAEDLARRQPWAVAAGALAAGFAASRFLKASSFRRYASRYTPPSGAGAAAPVAPSQSPPRRPPAPASGTTPPQSAGARTGGTPSTPPSTPRSAPPSTPVAPPPARTTAPPRRRRQA